MVRESSQLLRFWTIGLELDVAFMTQSKGAGPMLWTILAILLVLWLLGYLGGIAGNLVHLLLVIALVVLIVQLVTGRRVV